MIPTPPGKLGASGRALWRQVHRAVPEEAELDERDTAVLTLACRQRDDVAALEAMLRTEGLVAVGSTGQPRLSAVVAELRQSRLAVARLLGSIDLTIADAPVTAASKRASRAATIRHQRPRDQATLRQVVSDGA